MMQNCGDIVKMCGIFHAWPIFGDGASLVPGRDL